METVAVTLPKFSSSEEVSYKNCRLAHHFEYDLGYRPKLTAWNLSTGIGYHEGMEAYYKGYTMRTVKRTIKRWAEARWQEYEDLMGGAKKVDGGQRVSYIKQVELVNAMVVGYVKWVNEEGLDEDWETVSVEEKLYVELEGAATVLPMKLDLIQRNRRTERLRTLDHKTRAQFTHDMTPYQLSEQNANYALGVFAAYGEWPTEMAYREARKIVPSNRSKPPYFREILVALTQSEAIARAEEYIIVSNERMNENRAIYANPSACCGSWKNDWRVPCLKVHQGMDPLEALEDSDRFSIQDAYARYDEETR